MKMMKPDIIIRAMFFAAPLAFFSCKSKMTDPPPEAPLCITDSMAHIISFDTATLNTTGIELKLSGEISFDDKRVSKVYPFSSGQVLQVNVSVGDKVSKGQSLAVIKSADVSGNYNDLASTGNDLAIAKKEMDNEQSLFKNGIASEREYIEAKESYEKALTAQAKLKEQIDINGGGHTTANGTYVITSPLNGYVVEKKINPGSFIRTDAGDNLFTIGDISDVWVWANVYETDIAKVKTGYNAAVTTLAYPDSTFYGTIDEVSNILDPVTKVMRIRIKLPNAKGLLKPEMFANVVITNEGGDKAVGVSTKAVLSENGKEYVVIYHDKCNLEVREISILKTTGDRTFVTSGLQPGEKVIVKNQLLIFKALTEN